MRLNSLMEMTRSVAEIICITQITFKLTYNALSANNGWFSLLNFKLLANFWTRENWLYWVAEVVAKICLRTKSADLWSLDDASLRNGVVLLSLIILQKEWIQKRGNGGNNQSIRVPICAKVLFFYQFQHLDSFNLTTVCVCAVMWSHRSVVHSEDYAKPTTLLKERPDHNIGNYMPYSFRLVCGIFNVPQSLWTLKA